jgi:hypothetical protein
MLLVFLPQVFRQLIYGRNDHHYHDAGEADGMVRDWKHLCSLFYLDEEMLNMVKACRRFNIFPKNPVNRLRNGHFNLYVPVY